MNLEQALDRIDYLESMLREAEHQNERTEQTLERLRTTRVTVRKTRLFLAFLVGMFVSSASYAMQLAGHWQ